MRLDIRIPLGLLFVVFGVLLTAFGAASSSAIYDRSLQINVNLWWGVVLLVFGAFMFVLGRKGQKKQAHTAESSTAEPADKRASQHH